MIAYIDAYKHEFGVEPICRVLRENDMQIAPSAYYASKSRPRSERSVQDDRLVEVVKRVHAVNYSCYGVMKMWHALLDEGEDVGRDQTARLMRVAGVRGKIRGKKIVTTKPRPGAARYPDLVEREWDRGAPDRVWIADVTYVKTLEGMAYVSFVQDAGTRSILGFTVDERQAASLVVRSVQQAVSYRKRQNPSFVTDGVIHHSDAGSQSLVWL